MKNNRLLYIIIALMLTSVSALAGTVDKQQAARLGAKFVEANFAESTSLEWVCTAVTEKGNPSYHVFNGIPDGFVIVSACNLTSPILGYSETGYFDGNHIPVGLRYFLDGYGQSVDFAEEKLKKADFVIAKEWENLERCGKTQNSKSVVVEPLVSTHWDQECYYNSYCPKDNEGPCGCAYAGCVATSMAQVMKYWNHPQQGTGTHSYNSYLYGTISADFGSTTYHWDEMPESLQGNEHYVGPLIFHCGVSVDMNYGAYGSGALHQSITTAMSSYFGYGTSHNLERDDYSYDEWVSMMRDALDMALPILYAGTDGANMGHSFICDGYDDNGLFHINWSWGGVLDGYFSIDNLHTYNQTWNLAQKMIADAMPLDVYNNTPKAPSNLTVQPLSDNSYTCTVRWNNPTKALNNSNLTHIDQIIVKCDGRVVFIQDDVTPGAAMEITDEVPFYGLHDYQVYAVNNGNRGSAASENDVRFGPSCAWTIEAGTTSFNGWQGASIQIINNATQVIASLTTQTNSETFSVDVPLGHVSFAFAKGNSPVSNVNFVIKNTENQIVYSYSGSLDGIEEGIFLQTNNNCGNGSDCDTPTDFNAIAEDDHVVLTREALDETTDYNVYRNGTLLHTVHSPATTFIDEIPNHGGNCYRVTTFCTSGESEPSNEICVTMGEGCKPPTSLWYETTSSNKVKLTWETPQPHDGLSGFYIYRTKETDMNWQQIKTLGASYTSYTDNTTLDDETSYLYKVVAYYQASDCYSAPARSRYNESEYFVRVYWSVDGMNETHTDEVKVYPNPASNTIQIEGIEPTVIQLYNTFGQLAKTIENAASISLDGLAEGVYMLRIEDSEGKTFLTKMVVKR